ncbi:MAG: hypothetical protein DCF17_00325 [Shackletoniella antarctica]|uniref:DUF4268 domain-containing protein n=1 Tax=Shackletoniella antarctica TaxID=268115 RepID=A0A2W4WVC3_9CYAN|nr:MAG: hypothetical protein DCF17_00325 [Shackletoniella antarctica]
MAIPELGTLIEVNLREAWIHEAHSFTPWLALHLDALAHKLGISLELEGQEVPVDSFSADILARNPIDDSLVLIENQLAGSDHTHLGQIMTYLAGLDAHTVVWVAADFREAHLSALKWLNENTGDAFSFFAVKVKAVRIGSSPIAPVFEVMARPNNWERQLHAIAQETRQMSSMGLFRKEFWTHYVNRFPDELARYQADAASSRWRSLDGLDLVVTVYLAQKSVGVFIRGRRGMANADVFALLAPHSDRLRSLTGAELGNPEAGHYFSLSSFKCISADRTQWNGMSDWLHNTADAYEAALRDIFEGQA